MSLTEQASYRRKWSAVPALGALLGNARPQDHWYGYSSATDNIFENLSRIMEIYAVVKDYEQKIVKLSGADAHRVCADLNVFQHKLIAAARHLHEAGEDVASIREKLAKNQKP